VRSAAYKKPSPKCWCEFEETSYGNPPTKVSEEPGCPSCEIPVGPGLGLTRVLFAGDTHGDTNHVRWLIDAAKKEEAQAVFVLGDFGIWDHLDQGNFTDNVSRYALKHEIPVLFLPGNHDNYDLLFEWEADRPRCEDGFIWVKGGVGYSPRGHRWVWNGVRFMSLGGAYSIDKKWRVHDDEQVLARVGRKQDKGHSLNARERYILRTGQMTWWHQEEISQAELDHALRPGEVDVLLTHDKPRASRPDWNRKDIEDCWENQQAIQDVVDAKKPRVLLHGHLHYAYEAELSHPGGEETFVKALDCDPGASSGSGGSGDRHKSYAIMTMLPGKTDSHDLTIMSAGQFRIFGVGG